MPQKAGGYYTEYVPTKNPELAKQRLKASNYLIIACFCDKIQLVLKLAIIIKKEMKNE